jgi:uncharacterized RDD family membrane protein YckC
MIVHTSNRDHVSDGPQLLIAGIWWRVFAFLWDALLLSGFAWLIAYAVTSIFFHTAMRDIESLANLKTILLSYGGRLISSPQSLGSIVGAVLVIPQAIKLLYLAFWESSIGATPGKLLMGLKVLRLDGQGLSLEESVKRNFYKTIASIVPALTVAVLLPLIGALPISVLIAPFALLAALLGTLVFSIVDHLYVFIDSDNQSLHDQYAGSVVVQKPGTPEMQRAIAALAAIFILVPCGYFGAQAKSAASSSGKRFEYFSDSSSQSRTQTASTRQHIIAENPSPQPAPRARYDFQAYQHDLRGDNTPPTNVTTQPYVEPPSPVSYIRGLGEEVSLREQVALLTGDASIIEVAFYERTLTKSERREVILENNPWQIKDAAPAVVLGLRFSPFSESCGMLALRKISIQVSKQMASPKVSSDGYFKYTLNPATQATTESVELSCSRDSQTPILGSFSHNLPIGSKKDALSLELNVNTILK